jgi:pimeloyl-ACP methyl ester carboxylesterase
MNRCRQLPTEDARTARRRLTTAVVGSALACLLATGASARTTTVGPGSLDGCLRASRTTTLVTFAVGGANSERLRAGIVGKGRNALVLANQSDRNLCAWRPFARALARQGFRVLLFDYGSAAPEREVAAAARELVRVGAAQVILAGASEGAKAAIIAAARHPRLARAVIALSPERFLHGEDVTPAARRLTVPALVAVSQGDPYSAQDSPALERAFGSAHKRLVVVPGAAHGVQLLGGGSAATVAAAVYSFLQPFGSSRRPPSLSGECGSAVAASARSARAIAFTAGDGTALHGQLIGHGGTAVVLAHEWPNSLCGWFPYAAELGHSGFRVLLFDHRTKGSRLDLDVAAAVEEAKALGATRVVAMGASLGGAATLVAGGRDCFLVSGIVSASGEIDLRSYGRGVPPLYAVPYEARIAAPLLVIGSKGDGLVSEADVHALLGHVNSKSKRAVLVDGYEHGWTLLEGAKANAGIRRAVLDFLHSAGSPVPTGCART